MDYDENTSLYGLFSGHGGNEVAQYAVEALPPLIKNDLYYSGQYKKALIKAFIDFDGSLTKSVATQRMRFLRQQNIEANNFGRCMYCVPVYIIKKQRYMYYFSLPTS